MNRQQERERAIFEHFLEAVPQFRQRISGPSTHPDDDPPDVRFRDQSGREVGVELKAWLKVIIQAVRQLMTLPDGPRRRIGFRGGEPR